eukprot:TRINITY_DN977_c0_g1_i1.p1 TRINITY_DN977_c0_g1~~TRINITY_DN977_c0_g1_i1.p1  ORF type:complete len:1275 (-),score=517.83 TRINITY_DN977_c0_g1_i1:415-3978(-)
MTLAESRLNVDTRQAEEFEQTMQEALSDRGRQKGRRGSNSTGLLDPTLHKLVKGRAKNDVRLRNMQRETEEDIENEYEAHALYISKQHWDQRTELASAGIEAHAPIRLPEDLDNLYKLHKDDPKTYNPTALAQMFSMQKKHVEGQLILKEKEELERQQGADGDSDMDDSVSHMMEAMHGALVPEDEYHPDKHDFNLEGRKRPQYKAAPAPPGEKLFPWEFNMLHEREEKRAAVREKFPKMRRAQVKAKKAQWREEDAEWAAGSEERKKDREIPFSIVPRDQAKPDDEYTVHRIEITEGGESDTEDYAHFLGGNRRLMAGRRARHQLFPDYRDDYTGYLVIDPEEPLEKLPRQVVSDEELEDSDDEMEGSGRFQLNAGKRGRSRDGGESSGFESSDMSDDDGVSPPMPTNDDPISTDPFLSYRSGVIASECDSGDCSELDVEEKYAMAEKLPGKHSWPAQFFTGIATEKDRLDAEQWQRELEYHEKVAHLQEDFTDNTDFTNMRKAWMEKHFEGLEEDDAEGDASGDDELVSATPGDEAYTAEELHIIRQVEAGAPGASEHQPPMMRRQEQLQQLLAEREEYKKRRDEERAELEQEFAELLEEAAEDDGALEARDEADMEEATRLVQENVPWQYTMWLDESPALARLAIAARKNERLREKRAKRAREAQRDGKPISSFFEDIEDESEDEAELAAKLMKQEPEFERDVFNYAMFESLHDPAFNSRFNFDYDARTVLSQRTGDPLFSYLDEGIDQRALATAMIPKAVRHDGNLPPMDEGGDDYKVIRGKQREVKAKNRRDIMFIDTSKPPAEGDMLVLQPDGALRTATWNERRREHFKPIPPSKYLPHDNPKVDRIYYPRDEEEERLMNLQEIERLARQGAPEEEIARLRADLDAKPPSPPRLPPDSQLNSAQMLQRLAILADAAETAAEERREAGDSDVPGVTPEMVTFRRTCRDMMKFVTGTDNALPLAFSDVVAAYKLAGLSTKLIESDAAMTVAELAFKMGLRDERSFLEALDMDPVVRYRSHVATDEKFAERARRDPLLGEGVDQMAQWEREHNIEVLKAPPPKDANLDEFMEFVERWKETERMIELDERVMGSGDEHELESGDERLMRSDDESAPATLSDRFELLRLTIPRWKELLDAAQRNPTAEPEPGLGAEELEQAIRYGEQVLQEYDEGSFVPDASDLDE